MLFVFTVVGLPIAEFHAESISSLSLKFDPPLLDCRGLIVLLTTGGFIEESLFLGNDYVDLEGE